MKTLKILSAVLFTTGWCAAFLFFVFRYRFAFNYELAINDHYHLVFTLPLLLLLVLSTTSFKSGGGISIAKLSWLLLILFLCWLLLFSKYFSFGNEYFFVLVSVFFISSFFLRIKSAAVVYIVIAVLLLVDLFQICTGLSQWREAAGWENDSLSLAIKGTLENSGVYACYLTVHLPLWHWLYSVVLNKGSDLFQKKGKFVGTFLHNSVCRSAITVIMILVVAASVLLILKTESRTAYIAVMVVMAGGVIQQYGVPIKRYLLRVPVAIWVMCTALFVCLSAVAGYHLYAMKKMSAMGRLMKMDIAWAHLSDHFWIGTGIGRFTWYYPQWQEQYFAQTPDPPTAYFLSAGESYILFNEYLQWFETVGFIGTVLSVCFLVCFFISKSVKHKKFLNSVKLTVVAVMACGISSYPLHVNVILLLSGFCFAAALKLNERRGVFFTRSIPVRHKIPRVIFISTVTLIITAAGLKGLKEWRAVKEWKKIQQSFVLKSDKEKKFELLYSILDDNGKFLSCYTQWMIEDALCCNQAVKTAEQAKEFVFSRESMETTARVYNVLNDHKNTISQWEWIGNYLPNRFVPKYELLKAYQKAGDTVSAKLVALKIKMMPVKVNSDEIVRIKEMADEVLRN